MLALLIVCASIAILFGVYWLLIRSGDAWWKRNPLALADIQEFDQKLSIKEGRL